jgi:hypothetical protein
MNIVEHVGVPACDILKCQVGIFRGAITSKVSISPTVSVENKSTG